MSDGKVVIVCGQWFDTGEISAMAGFYRRYLVWLDAHRTFDDMLTREDRRWLKFIKVKA